MVTAWQLRARPSFSTHGDEEQLVRRRLCDGSLLAQAANLTMHTWFRRKGLKNAVTVSPFENTPFRRRPPAERLLLVLLAACVLGACAHQHVASTDPRSNTCDERGITIQWNRCDDVVVCVARTPCGQTGAL
ncbi:MAG: hypothetical protein ACPIOQ_63355 [Promethearchaeia archaeon]